MGTHISQGPEETLKIGEEWGRDAARGWVIGLSGELGAGKTQLVKGIARGLGATSRVHSPTFTLLNEYRGGRLPLFHMDLYRLNGPDEIRGAGLEEYLYSPVGVAVVEWIERLESLPQQLYRSVRIDVLDEKTRRIVYEDFGF